MVLYLIDKLLRVLHAHAEGERLGFEEPAVALEHVVYIARGMPRSQNHRRSRHLARVGHHAVHAAVPDDEVRDAGVEMIFPAGCLNGMPHVGDDAAEAVGAYMRVSLKHYVGVGTMVDEGAQHGADVAALGGTRVELAVAVGARAAFAEAPVAVGVDDLLARQPCDVVFALLHGLAALHDDGLHAQLQAAQGGEEARRAGADNEDCFWGE